MLKILRIGIQKNIRLKWYLNNSAVLLLDMIQNQIVNYFVDLFTLRVFQSPVTMNSEAASRVLSKEYSFKTSLRNLFHVCFDKDSKIIYTPNKEKFMDEQIEPALQAVKYHITKDWGDFKMFPIIQGSPFSSFRIRSVKSFSYVYEAIVSHFGSDSPNIPVIEANLARMPETVLNLPKVYHNNKNFSGGLIKDGSIEFIDEIDIKGDRRKKRLHLFTASAPFILIDTSPHVQTSPTEKEWAVLSGYRDYMMHYFNGEHEEDKIIQFAPLYAAKRYLYMGWPFEEVCKVFLSCVDNFGSMMKGAFSLLEVCESLEKEGYQNPSFQAYYISFCIDLKTFPFSFWKSELQIPFFEIIEFNDKTSEIIIKSNFYIDSNLCSKILKATSRPYIVRYNPTVDCIDVKSNSSFHKELLIKSQIPNKIKKLIERDSGKLNLKFRSDKRSKAESLSSNEMCHLRKISEYYYATDYIKAMCESRGQDFEDIDVLIGPIERIFGRGVQGGFMGEKEFEKSKLKTPYQIEKGLYVSPPIIAVNSDSMTSYASQTETLIHEYSHKLFSKTNPEHEHLYNKDPRLKDKNSQKYWELYLSDEDEELAHKEEIRFELESGKSVDEIVRDKVGGAITKNNVQRTYMIALRFKEIVDDVVKEIV